MGIFPSSFSASLGFLEHRICHVMQCSLKSLVIKWIFFLMQLGNATIVGKILYLRNVGVTAS
jgi:hypothetical protein